MIDKKLRGVNLGGWLVLEKWMTPSLFVGTDAKDEFSLSLSEEGKRRIRKHRATFLTESDFVWLREEGINAVRIPVGYWVLEENAPYLAGVEHLDWAMEMCVRYDIEAIIDVHGLNGSQNGQDHSGKAGKARWLKEKSLRNSSLDSLEAIAKRYRENPKLWGFQIINEPKLGIFQFKLRAYYKRAYTRVHSLLHEHTRIIFSDAFTPRLLSGALKRSRRVVMDVHSYHMATPLANYMSIAFYFRKLRHRGALFRRLSKTQPIIIGEWSSVISHEVLSKIPVENRDAITRQHVDIQLATFEPFAGWFYWSYKTESNDRWNFRAQIESENIHFKN